MIYWLADTHLRRRFWKRKELDGDSYRALSFVTQQILAERYEYGKQTVILAGDITDKGEIDGATFHSLDGFARDMYAAHIDVYYVLGNHDWADMNDFCEEVGFVNLEKAGVVVMDGCRFAGLGYRSREDLLPALEKVPACDVLVMHQSFEHLLSFEGAFDLSMDEMPPQVANIVSGDIHVPNITPFRNQSNFCCSPGGTIATKISEVHPRGYYKFGGLKGECPQYVTIPHRRILRARADTPEELAALMLPSVEKEQLLPLVELAYPMTMAGAVEEYMQRHSTAVFFPKPGYTGKLLAVAGTDRTMFDRLTLAGALPLAVDKDKEPEDYDLLHSLLNSNAAEVVAKKVEEALK